ncbi:hypothetical protein CFELI_13490 [Corynebacterium felinum]|uniref:Uncharacterized protein n=1 Tax=Corynebacterium felinum TaxID=131318 RepID=A0ABU2B7J3_9CORY|nr:hypothetical protein [Corynebacterium felinum]MDR7354234.1 hypothetical protein [Corynebacterium felinum]MDR7354330.1 hypothetical protein [Corynebacterium felinum]MDR7354578.1 hypothetical protein [Corynebacterium felinum]WJY93769.1 hypothetical protein CFELI_00560 [Corynebacterium felinum]
MRLLLVVIFAEIAINLARMVFGAHVHHGLSD